MGCGTSKTSTDIAEIPERDEEDQYLSPVVLIPTHIEQFDSLFNRAAVPLRKVIDGNNRIVDRCVDLRCALALVNDCLSLELTIGQRLDTILVQVILKDKKIADSRKFDLVKADKELQDSINNLVSVLESKGTYIRLSTSDKGLALTDDVNAHVNDAITRFNTSLSAFQSQLGAGSTASVVLVPCTSLSHILPRVRITHPVLRATSPPQLHHRPATPLEIARASSDLIAGAAALSSLCSQVGSATRGFPLSATTYSLTFPVTYDPPIRALLVSFNQRLFSLRKACLTSTAKACPLHQALLSVLTALRAVLPEQLPRSTYEALKSSLVVSVDEAAALTLDFRPPPTTAFGLPPFPDCLPAGARVLHASVQQLAAAVAELVPVFGALASELGPLLEEAQRLEDNAPEAASAAGLSMMEAMKAGKATACNVRELSTAPSLIAGILANVRSLGEELGRAVAVAEGMYGAAAARGA